ncbi:hypothetical protein C6988_06555 [Nitrosopumilus sp. b1]|nr:hypothetical protein C6988_06555 [Nitrosopumilus sp. b1]
MKKNTQNLYNEILSLLDKDGVTKKEIFEQLQEKHKVAPSEIRNSMRQVRADFLKKLNVLQSGVVRI